MAYIRIHRSVSEVEANGVISLLRGNGFNPIDLRRSTNIEIAGTDLDYFVEVPEEEAENARQALIELDVDGVIKADG